MTLTVSVRDLFSGYGINKVEVGECLRLLARRGRDPLPQPCPSSVAGVDRSRRSSSVIQRLAYTSCLPSRLDTLPSQLSADVLDNGRLGCYKIDHESCSLDRSGWRESAPARQSWSVIAVIAIVAKIMGLLFLVACTLLYIGLTLATPVERATNPSRYVFLLYVLDQINIRSDIY